MEEWKGPYVIVKLDEDNNTAVLNTLHGDKEYLFSTQMLKKFTEIPEQTLRPTQTSTIVMFMTVIKANISFNSHY